MKKKNELWVKLFLKSVCSTASLGAGSVSPLIMAVSLVPGIFLPPEKLFNYYSASGTTPLNLRAEVHFLDWKTKLFGHKWWKKVYTRTDVEENCRYMCPCSVLILVNSQVVLNYVPSSFHLEIQELFKTVLWDSSYYYPCFAEEKTGAHHRLRRFSEGPGLFNWLSQIWMWTVWFKSHGL